MELATTAALPRVPEALEVAAPRPSPAQQQLFRVGDRVEYRSDTYQQWMPGTVQKVADNGGVYDLDVKKGAPASKLRMARPVTSIVPTTLTATTANTARRAPSSQPAAYEGRLTADRLSVDRMNRLTTYGIAVDRPVIDRIATDRNTADRSPPGQERLTQEPQQGYTTPRFTQARPQEELLSAQTRPPSAHEELGGLAVDALFQEVDLNHDGVISRGEFRAGVQAHLIEGRAPAVRRGVAVRASASASGSPAGRAVAARPAATPPPAIPHWPVWAEEEEEEEPPPPPASPPRPPYPRRGGGGGRGVAGCGAGGRGVAGGAGLGAASAGGSASAGAPSNRWTTASSSGSRHRRSPSPSGDPGVTVKRMVDTTQGLLEGLAVDLLHCAGLLAGSFHAWRCEVKLGHAGRLYREELGRHHEDWASCLDGHRRSFEEELLAVAEGRGALEAAARQQKELLLEQWAYGDAMGLLRQTSRAWAQLAASRSQQRRCAASIGRSVSTWARGDDVGSLHSCFRLWSQLSLEHAEVRQREAALEQLQREYKERAEREAARAVGELRDQVQQVEERNQRVAGSVRALMERCLSSSARRTLSRAFRSWNRLSLRRGGRGREVVEAATRALLKGGGLEARANLQCGFVHWKQLAARSRATRESEVRLAEVRKEFDRLIDVGRLEREAELGRLGDGAERRRLLARAVADQALLRWDLGARKGLLAWAVRGWARTARTSRQRARAQQSVSDSIMQALLGQQRAGLLLCLLNWAGHARDARHARQSDAAGEEQERQWREFFDRTEEAHRDALGSAEAGRAEQLRRAVELVLSQWSKGDEEGLLRSCVMDWLACATTCRRRRRAKQAVIDAILRSLEGEALGSVQATFMSWRHAAEAAREARRAREEAARPAVERMRGCLGLLGASSARLFLGIALTAWRSASLGAKERLEQERQQESALAEMRLQHEISSARRRQEQCQALEALGGGSSRFALQSVLLAWSIYHLRCREQQAAAAKQCSVLESYAGFVEARRLTGAGAPVLRNCFTAWYRQYVGRAHERRAASARAEAAQLEEQAARCREQLEGCYKEIDAITATLEEELRNKEELARELRAAYDRLREATNEGRRPAAARPRVAATAPAANIPLTRGARRAVSPTSSEETFDEDAVVLAVEPQAPPPRPRPLLAGSAGAAATARSPLSGRHQHRRPAPAAAVPAARAAAMPMGGAPAAASARRMGGAPVPAEPIARRYGDGQLS